jgi:hypothetical protein
MAGLQEQPPVEIPLGGGPNESQGKLFRSPNVLEANTNGSTDKQGYLVKERGFTRVPTSTTTEADQPDAFFISVATDHEELLLVGMENTYTVAATGPDLSGAALILRGPTLLGNYRAGTVHATSLSEG